MDTSCKPSQVTFSQNTWQQSDVQRDDFGLNAKPSQASCAQLHMTLEALRQ